MEEPVHTPKFPVFAPDTGIPWVEYSFFYMRALSFGKCRGIYPPADVRRDNDVNRHRITQKDIRTLTKFIVISAWISFTYGALQIVDGFLPGADFLTWRGFFTRRIFATHANPNFFGAFVVFASCVTCAQYLATRKKSLLVLLGLGLVELFFTESKGAWLAYGVLSHQYQ